MFDDAGQTQLLRRIFQTYLPPWTERVGYPPVPGNLNNVFPEGTYPIPLDLAPGSSLDGLVVDAGNSPRNPVELARFFDTLAPGGIGVFFLDADAWPLKEIHNACRSADFRVLFYSRYVRTGNKKQKITENGLPVPPGWFARLRLAVRMSLFPSVRFLGGNGSLVIVEKKFSASPTDLRLSVVLTLSTDRTKAVQQIQRWDEYLTANGFQDAELVYVDQAGTDPVNIKTRFESTVRVAHYKESTDIQNGEEERLRSGLAFARGRRVIVDLSEGICGPEMTLPLFEKFQKTEKSVKKDHFAFHAAGNKRNAGFLHSFFAKYILGTTVPGSLFRMYPLRTARLLAGLHPQEVIRFPELTSYIIKENRGRIHDTETVSPEIPVNPRKLQLLRLIKKIYAYKNGRLISGAVVSLLLLSVLSFLSYLKGPLHDFAGYLHSVILPWTEPVTVSVSAKLPWLLPVLTGEYVVKAAGFITGLALLLLFFFTVVLFDRIVASYSYQRPADPKSGYLLSFLRAAFLLFQAGVFAASYYSGEALAARAASALDSPLYMPGTWTGIIALYLNSLFSIPGVLTGSKELSELLPFFFFCASQILILIAFRKSCRRSL